MKRNNRNNKKAQKAVRERPYSLTKKDIASTIMVGVIAFAVFRFVVMLSPIMSESMEPTMMTGEYGIFNRLAYVSVLPERGDIIAFKHVTDETVEPQVYLKRVIGLPGEEILFEDGYVFVNGSKLNEPYISDDIETNSYENFTVPDNCVFVLGDNRENSRDSRYWDYPYVSYDEIKGKAMVSVGFPKILDKSNK